MVSPSSVRPASIPVIRLKLLGGLRLDAPASEPLGRAGQPKRLAVMALLALARDRTQRRDQLIPLLWPDRTEDAARRLLSSVVYDVRAVLGEAALEASGDALTLRLDSLEVDTIHFEASIRSGRWSDAIALHTGELLAGIDLGGSAELEQLIDQHRGHFLSGYAQALEREGERLVQLGEADRAIELWTRHVEIRPYEADIVLRLARALDARGHRARALEQARLHVDRVRRDLDSAAAPAVVALMDQLRSSVSVARASAALPGAQSNGSLPSPPATALPPAVSKPRRHRLRWFVGVAAAAALVVARTVGGRVPARGDVSGPVHVAVFPFVVVGDSDAQYLGAGMTRLLSTDLDGGGRLVSVSPELVLRKMTGGESAGPDRFHAAASDLGAQQYVTGTVTANGQRLRLTALLHSTEGPATDPREVAVEGLAGDLPALVDSLSVRLLVGEALPAQRLVRIAAATTGSIPALKAYLRGEQLLRDGAYAAAAAAFDRATRVDPTFALAHYRCALATLWADLPGTSTAEHDAQALQFADRLAPRDRELILAYSAWRNGDAAAADRRYRALWTRYPDDAEAGFQLAETIFHYGPLIGRPIEESRGVFQEVLRIDPGHRGAQWHLVLLDGTSGHRTELRQDVTELTPPGTDVESRGVALRTDGKPLAADALVRAAAPGQLWSLGWRLAVNLRDFAGAREAFGLVTQREPAVRSMAFRGEALLGLAEGRWDSQASLETVGGQSAGLVLDGPVINRVLSLSPETTSRLLAGARAALAAIDSSAGDRLADRIRLQTAIGRLALVLRDSAGVSGARTALLRLGDSTAVHSLDAFAAARDGRNDDALRELDQARRNVWFGLAVVDPYFGQQAERFLRAELLLQSGRLDEALRWYAGFGEFALDDLPYLARAEQRRAEIYVRLNRPQEAANSVARAADLWRDADSLLVPYAAAVRKPPRRLSSRVPF